jgi:hypothetical protein
MGQNAGDPALRLKSSAAVHRSKAGATPDVVVAQDAIRNDKGGRLHHVHRQQLHEAPESNPAGTGLPAWPGTAGFAGGV